MKSYLILLLFMLLKWQHVCGQQNNKALEALARRLEYKTWIQTADSTEGKREWINDSMYYYFKDKGTYCGAHYDSFEICYSRYEYGIDRVSGQLIPKLWSCSPVWFFYGALPDDTTCYQLYSIGEGHKSLCILNFINDNSFILTQYTTPEMGSYDDKNHVYTIWYRRVNKPF